MRELELTAEKMVAEGRALARPGGFVVFIEGALPGERVRVRITQRKKSFAFAQAIEVLEPSPDRQSAPCPVFGTCGGCAFQHMAYPAQLRAKHQILLEALYGLPGVPGLVAEPMGMAEPLHFRNKMGFAFGVGEGQPVLGLHRRGDWHSVVPAGACLLQSPESREILARVLTFVQEHTLPVYDDKRRTGLLRHLVVREGKLTGERMVHLHAAERHPAFERLPAVLGELATTVLASFHILVPESAPPGSTVVLSGRGLIHERLNGFLFEIGPATFFQTNTLQGERLFGLVRDWAGALRPERAVDLYAGTGPIAIHLAAAARQVLGIESHAPSVDAARRNVELNGLANVRMVCAEAERIGDTLREEQADLVVVDPPRPGLHPKALAALLAAAPPNLIYVSCNPATLARDLKKLIEAGYGLEQVQSLDMFPHTFHIEAVARLKKSA
jgi:23S rRNA (uracil1939-C5)-methyltransferase